MDCQTPMLGSKIAGINGAPTTLLRVKPLLDRKYKVEDGGDP